jgi:uncharacterized protein YndB with AHSA1/START domain
MPAIRRQVTIETPARTAWNALTTGDGLASWLADEARVDGRVGGRVVLKMDDVEELGVVQAYRPTSKFEVTFDKISPGPWKGTSLAISVARDGNETVVNLVHAGSCFDDEPTREEADSTWRRALAGLRDALEG